MVANAEAALVGRVAELETLATLIERAAEGQPTTAFIEGDAGIGKSRLLDEAAEQVRARQGLVIRGDAPPTAGEPMPFASISRLLRDLLRQIGPDERESMIVRSLGLGHLQPAWRLGPGMPPMTSSAAMSEELLDVVDTVAQARPLLALIVDDLQWADPATLDLLAYIARSTVESRVLMIFAARLQETALDAPLRRMRAELLRVGARSIPLGALDADDASRYVSSLTGDDLPPDRRREIAALGQGNPLFLRELVSATGGRGSGGPGPGSGGSGLPESLVALTRARLTTVSEAEVTILQVVATVGPGCTEDIVIRTLAQPEAATIDSMRRLLDGRLLVLEGDGSLAIGHPVLRDVVLGDALDAQRRRICGAVARLLAVDPEILPGSEAERRIRLANLWFAAGDRIRAFPALVRAAEAAEESFAFVTAFDLYAKALRIADAESAPSTERKLGFQPPTADASLVDLRRRAADAAILAGEPRIALEWLDLAGQGVGDQAMGDRLAFTRARALLALGDPSGAVSVYRAAMNDRPASDLPGPARAGFARALASSGDTVAAIEIAESALAAARSSGSRGEEETALVILGAALARSGDLDTGMQRLHEARSLRLRAASLSAVRPRVSRVMDLTAGLVEAASMAQRVGLRDEADLLVGDAEAAATRLGAESETARLRVTTAVAATDAGRWDEALAILDDAVDRPGAAVAALTRRARIAALRGAWERAAADLARCEDAATRSRPEDRAAFALALTDLHGWRRQSDAAIAAATEGLVLAKDAPPDDHLELVALAIRAHVDAALGARAMRSGGEAQQHEEIARALVEEASRRPIAEGPRLTALAATAHAEAGRLHAGDEQPWADALAAWESDGAVWWTAYASFREAEALLSGSGRRDAARDVLVRARLIAAGLEAAPLLAEIDGLATRGRIELPVPSADAAQPRVERKLPISDRELEVLVLIAKGLTNKEIATTLFISERTAAHHVGHIFDKLGVSSRVEAAGMAHQAGVLGD